MKYILSQGNILGSVGRLMIRNDSVEKTELIHNAGAAEIHIDGNKVALYENTAHAELVYKLLGMWLGSEDANEYTERTMKVLNCKQYGDNVFILPTIEAVDELMALDQK